MRLLTLGRLAVRAASFPWGSGSSLTGMKGCQGLIDIAPLISTCMGGGCGGGGTGAGRWERGQHPDPGLAQPEETSWFLAGRRRSTGVLSCLPPLPIPLNSHLCPAGLRPGLISQPYTLASEGRLGQGSRSHWLRHLSKHSPP